MVILPAIDLRDGQVVRLLKGDYARQKTYADDPSATAEGFLRDGARWVHVVDLDAARSGKPGNLESLRGILAVARSGGAKVQFGGGVRDRASIDSLLDEGADRLVIGSAALKNWAWFEQLLGEADLPGRLALGLDAREGRVAAEGWTEQLETTAVELAGRVGGSGLGAIVYTDIARDGMLSGVNVEATAEIVGATDVPVIASGGLSSVEDVRACRDAGCAGAILGRAMYEGKLTLSAALRAAEGER
jgi:phosphoribosylformimino-5-aminoimidazole carboxamide ribotide isomerase